MVENKELSEDSSITKLIKPEGIVHIVFDYATYSNYYELNTFDLGSSNYLPIF